MTEDDIRRISDIIDKQAVIYFDNERYITGKNAVDQQKKKKNPDNRIPVPLAKTAIEDLAGYAGGPGAISITYDNITTEEDERENKELDDYQNVNKDIAEYNKASIETSRLYTECISQGASYELFWISEDEQATPDGLVFMPEYAIVKGYEIAIETDGKIKPKITKAYRKYTINDKSYIDVYMPLISERWERDSKEAVWKRQPEGDTSYPWTDVPIAVYKANDREAPIFEAEKPMIDGYDKAMSQSVDELDRFNAAIAVFKEHVAEIAKEAFKAGDISVIDKQGGPNGEGGGNLPRYLEKNLSGVSDFYNRLMDRLKMEIRSGMKIPDFTELELGSDPSGTAMAFKILGLEFRADQIEIGFNAGLETRQKLIDAIISASPTRTIRPEDYKMSIKWERNLPMNRASIIKMVIDLQALGVSREIWLKLLPEDVLDDVDKEIARQDGLSTLDDAEITDDTNIVIGNNDESVQSQALNGAQMDSIVDIAEKVKTGLIEESQGIAALLISIPSLTEAQARQLMPSTVTPIQEEPNIQE